MTADVEAVRLDDDLRPVDGQRGDHQPDGHLLRHELRSFGRRRGRTANSRQRIELIERLRELGFDLSRPAVEQLDLERETWLEIGFGGGEHMLLQAAAQPDVTIIGCEPFQDGVVKVLTGIDGAGLRNIRLHADDVRPILRWLPASSIGRVFVLFPDPWPKKKHIKRRLLNSQTLDSLARVMRPGGELRFATDIGDYARTTLLAVMSHPSFEWPARGPEDWRERPPDWPPTRYEAKAVIEGRRSSYFRFRRIA